MREIEKNNRYTGRGGLAGAGAAGGATRAGAAVSLTESALVLSIYYYFPSCAVRLEVEHRGETSVHAVELDELRLIVVQQQPVGGCRALTQRR